MQAAPGAAATYRFARSGDRLKVGLKLAGVHWCVKSYGHAAELTAGYYNTAHRNGYRCAPPTVCTLLHRCC
jgi:Glycosyl hydrolase family 14